MRETIVVTDLAAEVLTLATVQDYLKVSGDATVINNLIKSTREVFEEYSSVSFGMKSLKTLFSELDGELELHLPFGPDHSSIVVKRVNEDGTETTLTLNSDYRITGLKNKVVHLYKSYSTGVAFEPSYLIEYKAGYGNTDGNSLGLPEAIKTSMLKQIADLYTYRTSDLVKMSVSQLSMDAKDVLAPFRNEIAL